jgi:hypothetical protein
MVSYTIAQKKSNQFALINVRLESLQVVNLRSTNLPCTARVHTDSSKPIDECLNRHFMPNILIRLEGRILHFCLILWAGCTLLASHVV